MFTIVGAGFGLYGYLPAIVNASQGGVLLAEQYRQVIESRPELNRYIGRIEWCPTLNEALSHVSSVVIAVPPLAQKNLVEQVLSLSSINRLLIEKPICPSPHESVKLTDNLLAHSKCFRVGYTFLYTNWYRELKTQIYFSALQLRITWLFKADHFLRDYTTWKRYHSQGGGALRFYGIHLVAVLASLGYTEVIWCELLGDGDQPTTWRAQFSGVGVPPCHVHVFANSEQNDFQVGLRERDNIEKIVHKDASPFPSMKSTEGQDSRVPVLEQLIRSLDYDSEEYVALYRKINNLWARAELHQNSKV